MRENHVTVSQFKGVNLTDPEHTIDDRELSQLQNLLVSDTGDLMRRKPLTWFYDHYPNGEAGADATYMLGVFFNRCFWYNTTSKLASLTNVNTQINGSVAQTVALGNNLIDVVLYNNVLYGVTGNANNPTLISIAPSDWTSDTPTLTITNANQPLCANTSRLVMFKDRAFGIQNFGQKSSRVTYSDLAAPGSWTAGNMFDVNPGDGDYIVDLLPFQERLFVFKRNSTWILIPAGGTTDPKTWTAKLFDNSIGACHRHCVLEFGGLLYVLTPRGLYRTDGVVYDYIGYPIQNQFLDRLVAPPSPAGNFTDGSIFICRVDDQIFVCPNNSTVGWWFYNPSQNAWSQAVFGGGFVNPNNFQLLYGVQGRLADGTRHTWLGTSGTAGYYGSRVLWFDSRNPLSPTGYSFSDRLGPYYNATLIDTAFKTKKWDAGAWYKTKRHVGAELEILVPVQQSQVRYDYRINWNYNSDGVTAGKWYRNSQFFRGPLAHRLQGMGYVRRVQMQYYSNSDVDYTINALDQVYLQKRDMAEIRQ